MVEKIGERVRKLRTERNWTQRALGDLAGLGSSYASYVESGKRHPNSLTLRRLAHAFGISLQELVEGTDVEFEQDTAEPYDYPEIQEVRSIALRLLNVNPQQLQNLIEIMAAATNYEEIKKRKELNGTANGVR